MGFTPTTCGTITTAIAKNRSITSLACSGGTTALIGAGDQLSVTTPTGTRIIGLVCATTTDKGSTSIPVKKFRVQSAIPTSSTVIDETIETVVAAVVNSEDLNVTGDSTGVKASPPVEAVSQYVNTGNAGDGIPIYVATTNGIVKGVSVAPDENQTENALGAVEFFLYRAGSVVGGGRFAGWDAESNPAMAVGSVTQVPFDNSNTEVSEAGVAVQTNDVVFCKTASFGILVSLSV